jgi:hypothetical protein
MEQLFMFNFPVPDSDIQKLSEFLRSCDPIVSIWSREKFDPYDLMAYMKERHVHNNKFIALTDLNIASNGARIAEGKPTTDTIRQTAGLIAFMSLAGTIFDVGLAHIEQGQHRDRNDLNNHADLFNIADNLHPQILVDIALGRLDTVPEAEKPASTRKMPVPSCTPHVNVEMQYIGLLKICELYLSGKSSLTEYKVLMDWMWSDFMFSAPLFLFAGIFFSHKPHKGMLKGIGSKDPERILRGVRNATWDLSLLHLFASRVTDPDPNSDLWILCSLDKGLRAIANFMILTGNLTPEACHKQRIQFLAEYWSDKDAVDICTYFDALQADTKNPKRRRNQIQEQREFLALAPYLEKEIHSTITAH